MGSLILQALAQVKQEEVGFPLKLWMRGGVEGGSWMRPGGGSHVGRGGRALSDGWALTAQLGCRPGPGPGTGGQPFLSTAVHEARE